MSAEPARPTSVTSAAHSAIALEELRGWRRGRAIGRNDMLLRMTALLASGGGGAPFMGKLGEWEADEGAAPLEEEGHKSEGGAMSSAAAEQADTGFEMGGEQLLTKTPRPSPCALLAGTAFEPKRPVREKCCANQGGGGVREALC